MIKIIFIFLFFFIVNCSSTKTVLICGDHVCINKDEAEQYFEENLSLEVKIIDKTEKNKIDLVELNLKSNEKSIKTVSITEKDNTNKDIKILTNDEIKKKKLQLKNRERLNKIKDKNDKRKKLKKVQKNKIKNKKQKKFLEVKKTDNKSKKQIVDICVILENCNIEEISKYLIEQGKKKGFPDITLRE